MAVGRLKAGPQVVRPTQTGVSTKQLPQQYKAGTTRLTIPGRPPGALGSGLTGDDLGGGEKFYRTHSAPSLFSEEPFDMMQGLGASERMIALIEMAENLNNILDAMSRFREIVTATEDGPFASLEEGGVGRALLRGAIALSGGNNPLLAGLLTMVDAGSRILALPGKVANRTLQTKLDENLGKFRRIYDQVRESLKYALVRDLSVDDAEKILMDIGIKFAFLKDGYRTLIVQAVIVELDLDASQEGAINTAIDDAFAKPTLRERTDLFRGKLVEILGDDRSQHFIEIFLRKVGEVQKLFISTTKQMHLDLEKQLLEDGISKYAGSEKMVQRLFDKENLSLAIVMLNMSGANKSISDLYGDYLLVEHIKLLREMFERSSGGVTDERSLWGIVSREGATNIKIIGDWVSARELERKLGLYAVILKERTETRIREEKPDGWEAMLEKAEGFTPVVTVGFRRIGRPEGFENGPSEYRSITDDQERRRQLVNYEENIRNHVESQIRWLSGMTSFFDRRRRLEVIAETEAVRSGRYKPSRPLQIVYSASDRPEDTELANEFDRMSDAGVGYAPPARHVPHLLGDKPIDDETLEYATRYRWTRPSHTTGIFNNPETGLLNSFIELMKRVSLTANSQVSAPMEEAEINKLYRALQDFGGLLSYVTYYSQRDVRYQQGFSGRFGDERVHPFEAQLVYRGDELTHLGTADVDYMYDFFSAVRPGTGSEKYLFEPGTADAEYHTFMDNIQRAFSDLGLPPPEIALKGDTVIFAFGVRPYGSSEDLPVEEILRHVQDRVRVGLVPARAKAKGGDVRLPIWIPESVAVLGASEDESDKKLYDRYLRGNVVLHKAYGEPVLGEESPDGYQRLMVPMSLSIAYQNMPELNDASSIPNFREHVARGTGLVESVKGEEGGYKKEVIVKVGESLLEPSSGNAQIDESSQDGLDIDILDVGPVLGGIDDRIAYWRAAYSSLRIHVRYALESGMRGRDLQRFIKSQLNLLNAIFSETEQVLRGLDESSRQSIEIKELRHNLLSPLHHSFQSLLLEENIDSRLKGMLDLFGSIPSLDSVMAGVKLQYSRLASEKRMQINGVRLEGLSFADHVDLHKIEIMVSNMLSNAIRFAKEPHGGIVPYFQLRVERNGDGDVVKLIFEDNGTGMPAEKAATYGRELFREDLARVSEGNPIGNRTVVEYAESMGWGVEVVSHKDEDVEPKSEPTTQIIFHINEGDVVLTEELSTARSFIVDGPRSYEIIYDGAIAAFENEESVGVGSYDVSGAPLYQSIERARRLREFVERSGEGIDDHHVTVSGDRNADDPVRDVLMKMRGVASTVLSELRRGEIANDQLNSDSEIGRLLSGIDHSGRVLWGDVTTSNNPAWLDFGMPGLSLGEIASRFSGYHLVGIHQEVVSLNSPIEIGEVGSLTQTGLTLYYYNQNDLSGASVLFTGFDKLNKRTLSRVTMLEAIPDLVLVLQGASLVKPGGDMLIKISPIIADFEEQIIWLLENQGFEITTLDTDSDGTLKSLLKEVYHRSDIDFTRPGSIRARFSGEEELDEAYEVLGDIVRAEDFIYARLPEDHEDEVGPK